MTSPTDTIRDIKAARKGEQRAYRRLFEAYSAGVYATVMRITGDEGKAEELTQDVFIKAFRCLDTFDKSVASFSTWISRIAYNESVSHLRSRRPPPTASLDDGADDVAVPESLINQAFSDPSETRAEQLTRAIETLPPEEQHLLTLFYYEDCSMQEISYITDRSIAALSSHLARIRKKLYNLLTVCSQ